MPFSASLPRLVLLTSTSRWDLRRPIGSMATCTSRNCRRSGRRTLNSGLRSCSTIRTAASSRTKVKSTSDTAPPLSADSGSTSIDSVVRSRWLCELWLPAARVLLNSACRRLSAECAKRIEGWSSSVGRLVRERRRASTRCSTRSTQIAESASSRSRIQSRCCIGTRWQSSASARSA